MKIYVITLFPEFFEFIKGFGPVKRAILAGSLEVIPLDMRKFAPGPKEVDGRPFGGGSGMVIRVDVVVKALRSIKEGELYKVLLDPRGEVLNQKKVKHLLRFNNIVLICGRYKGIDERIKYYIDEEISIGDYVLSGGEPAGYVIIDALARLLPGGVGDIDSPREDSFEIRFLGYPVYTKPRDFEGKKVPDVLISGNHREIKKFLKKESLKITFLKRPDILKKVKLTEEERKLLEDIKRELKK